MYKRFFAFLRCSGYGEQVCEAFFNVNPGLKLDIGVYSLRVVNARE